jgi:hypothetical protein
MLPKMAEAKKSFSCIPISPFHFLFPHL